MRKYTTPRGKGTTFFIYLFFFFFLKGHERAVGTVRSAARSCALLSFVSPLPLDSPEAAVDSPAFGHRLGRTAPPATFSLAHKGTGLSRGRRRVDTALVTKGARTCPVGSRNKREVTLQVALSSLRRPRTVKEDVAQSAAT